jgi:hypothetical protein
MHLRRLRGAKAGHRQNSELLVRLVRPRLENHHLGRVCRIANSFCGLGGVTCCAARDDQQERAQDLEGEQIDLLRRFTDESGTPSVPPVLAG